MIYTFAVTGFSASTMYVISNCGCSETISEKEGVRSYDIKFKVKLPTQEEAELIINLESQNKYRPGYTLEKRGIYYLSRLISSQYNVEFKNSNFDQLKKVYSILICTHAPLECDNHFPEYPTQPDSFRSLNTNSKEYPASESTHHNSYLLHLN